MYDASIEPLASTDRLPRNKGKLIGQKHPLTLKQVWAIRMRLQMGSGRGISRSSTWQSTASCAAATWSACGVRDVVHGDQFVSQATVMQRKTGQPVRFEVTEQTRDAVRTWIAEREFSAADYLFPSRIRASRHLSTRQYARIVRGWASLIGLNPRDYGTHSLRRTKATLIYRRTKNLRAVQLLLGHANLQSTVAYLGLEVDDALEIAGHTEI